MSITSKRLERHRGLDSNYLTFVSFDKASLYEKEGLLPQPACTTGN